MDMPADPITRIAAALERIAAALEGQTTKPADAPPQPPKRLNLDGTERP